MRAAGREIDALLQLAGGGRNPELPPLLLLRPRTLAAAAGRKPGVVHGVADW